MKKFKLDLSKYEVTAKMPVTKEDKEGKEVHVMEDQTQEYPLRDNIGTWLRSFGVFKTGEDIAEAVGLAKQIRDIEGDSITLDEREADVLKRGINRMIELSAEGKANLGGPIHEEAICRIFTMEEVE